MTGNKRANKKIFPAKKMQPKTEIICKHFGCGKALTVSESLFSDYCFSHSQKQNQDRLNKKLFSL